MEQTTIRKAWLWKMLGVLALLVGFGLYGLYDAVVAYPKRGREHASYSERSYLSTLRTDGVLTHATAAVPEPAQELDRLIAARTLSPAEQSKREWLQSLSRVGDLDVAKLTDKAGQPIDVAERLRTLDDRWSASNRGAPIPLGRFDIPTQWIFVIIGVLGGTWILSKVLPTISKKYLWDAATKTLTLPAGDKLSPGDIADFDKRDWKRFFIHLKVKPDHATLAGKDLKIDLYTHEKLEAWILEMERIAFPDRAAGSAGQPGAAGATGTTP